MSDPASPRPRRYGSRLRAGAGLGAALAAALWLLGCSGTAPPPETAAAIAGGFSEYRIPAGRFTLYTLLRRGSGDTLRVYIEGDGHAYLSLTTPSRDPTPREPVALRMAMADRSADNVLYLARPCQYVRGDERAGCEVRYWTSGRLAPEVIDSLNGAITLMADKVKATKTALMGFSGGAGAAVLLAARRPDARFVGTAAGLINTAVWTNEMKLAPLTESLNPEDAQKALIDVNQIHVFGLEDKVIPPEVARKFCRALPPKAQCLFIPGMSHNGAWERVFRDYAQMGINRISGEK